jgi:2-(1,2-epoxy-1,2-dihydrophenyl)acetyl-CoA isomerase
MTEPSSVVVEWDGPVAIVALNRPERLNALSYELVERLHATLSELNATPQARAVVLTGTGRAFCSGADLRSGERDPEDVLRTFYTPLLTTMRAMEIPLVAAVNGPAVGAAVGLALACDLRVAARGASFLLPFTGIGLVPDAGTTWMLPRAVGATRAAEMCLTGRAVPADEALSWGLVNAIADDGEVVPAAVALAQTVAARSTSVGAARQLLLTSGERTFSEQLDAEATAQGIAGREPDFADARQAFVERRPPQFAPRRVAMAGTSRPS